MRLGIELSHQLFNTINIGINIIYLINVTVHIHRKRKALLRIIRIDVPKLYPDPSPRLLLCAKTKPFGKQLHLSGELVKSHVAIIGSSNLSRLNFVVQLSQGYL